jgi:hypothetical protein
MVNLDCGFWSLAGRAALDLGAFSPLQGGALSRNETG